jgi:hypothetical protein
VARDNLQAKVDRADELRQSIEREINEYLLAGPFRLRDQMLPDPPRFEVFVDSIDPPPPRLGVLVGDFVHNLRSALDHVVWQLALTRGDEPSTELQFPIVSDRERWPGAVRRRLPDVPDEAVRLIETMQPYHHDDPMTHPLAVLRDLSNEDKHRVILEAMSVPVEPTPPTVEGEDVAESMELDMAWGAPYEPGARVLTAYYTPTGPRPRFHITSAMPIEMTFGTMHFAAAAMRDVVDDVRRTLDAFAPFLPS